ncbi:MAG: hypothetical protein JO002_13405, partial [Burkholderiaceae bacterium]|nr:hypothetical protein [Burkholderiaceae bacterium]
EDPHLLEQNGENAAHLYGADIVKQLSPEIGILVALTDRSFGIPSGLVGRLKQSLEAAAAKAKAVAAPAPVSVPAPKPMRAPAPAAAGDFPLIDASMVNTVQPAPQKSLKIDAAPARAEPAGLVLQPLAPLASAPAPSMSLALEPAAPAPAFAPMPSRNAPAKPSVGYFDVAALRPRSVGLSYLGLDFFIPGAWKETKAGKILEFVDASGQLKLEAGGTARPGKTMDEWLAMRTQTLAQAMPYLKQVGEARNIEGEDWGERVTARAVEFRGTPAGTREEQSCLLCCLRTDSVLAYVLISATSEVFENNRPLYKWLLPRVNLAVRAEDVVQTDNVIDDGLQSHSSLVASGLRMIIISALCNGVLVSQIHKLHVFVVLYLLLCIAGFGCFGLYRITQGLRFPGWAKVVFFIGMCIPGVSLILIILLRWRARSYLREGGYGTRIWNLHQAIDDTNHDLRNILLVALALALPVYGVAHVAEKKLGLERKMVVFSAPDHSFSALMPDSPSSRVGAPAGSDEQVWTATTHGIEYNAGYTWTTESVEDQEQALRDFAKSRTRAMEWSMDSSLADEIDGHEARRVEATAANGNPVTAEYVLVERRVFMFWVELPAKHGDEDALKAEEFIGSVSLK